MPPSVSGIAADRLSKPRCAIGYAAFQAVMFGLLAANTVLFFLRGSRAAALDGISWLTLLLLFEFEVRHPAKSLGGRAALIARPMRIAAAIAIVWATAAYIEARQWPDVFNSSLWIAVALLLEGQVRWPAALARHPKLFAWCAGSLYCGLGALVLVWLAYREWFDAYDAALWLVAFATIENDVMHARRPSS